MIKVLKAGMLTSIQDLGRMGYRNYGVPVSGVMDLQSALLSNTILRNDKSDAVMEITLQGPKLQFETKSKIAITGADLSPTLNGDQVLMNSSVRVEKDDVLQFGKRRSGARSYLAISGGFQTEVKLKSRSQYQGLTAKNRIEEGDEIAFHSSFQADTLQEFSVFKSSIDFQNDTLDVLAGPEFELLNGHQKTTLFNLGFTIGFNNRMGYQLDEPIANKLTPILSSAVLPGTIQLTPSGKLIVLMRDGQTTGGYPRILQLTFSSIDHLAHKIQHEVVKFQLK